MPGQRGRHVEQRALVQVRHELGAELARRPDADREHGEREHDHQRLGAHHALDDRAVDPDQEAVDRILVLRNDLAADEDHHQRRHQRDRQQRGGRHRERLGERQRAEQPPLLRFQREDRHERHRDDQQAEEQRRSHLGRRLDQDVDARLSGLRPFEVLVGVLDHDDGRIDHGADRDRDAAEAHDVGAEAEQLHGAECHQDADRQHQDRHQRAADVQQEHDADQRDDDAFLEQRVLERVDGGVDQVGAVVDRHDLDRLRQAGGDLLEALLDVLDDVERVDAEALQHDAAGDLAFAVQFGDAAPLVGTEFDPRDVPQQHRRAVVRLQHDVAEVVDRLDVALAADDVLELGEFDGPPADIGVAGADRVAHLLHGDAEVAHPLRIEDHVVLLDEAADARDLGDAFGLGQRELQIPVLDGARVGQVQFLRHHRVLVDPADAGRVGTDRRRHAGRQPRRRAVEEFQHARARPVDVGAVLEDDVDERDAEEREAADDLRLRHRQHRRRQRVGDLVLDHLRRLARIFRVDDDLGVGEVGDGIERQMDQRVDAGRSGEAGAEQHQQQVAGRPGDEARDHCCAPSAKPFSAAFRLLSASIRKFAETTTGSPSATPCRTSTYPAPR